MERKWRIRANLELYPKKCEQESTKTGEDGRSNRENSDLGSGEDLLGFLEAVLSLADGDGIEDAGGAAVSEERRGESRLGKPGEGESIQSGGHGWKEGRWIRLSFT